MPDDHPHTGRAAMLYVRHSDRERRVLPACKCNGERHLLFGTRRQKPHPVPGNNPDRSGVRRRLYENARRKLLQ
jgi:hypothetical protein